ncbi:ParB N-terminal domain-containing protein [Gluconobacter sp. LMG 31484]|uniref:ParB N-terminal domain-containing protein n=1 Tax=Gluconobacter vitians TaxID=2728102 RepID=A0ABR9Y4F6_9PROT|nr:ParB N-terminal domain-containing protein [Gluconobacter vitians]MBF0858831.1 ParB N-terminal domain-containing protein [Gluconobacter vitians]
MNVIEIPLSQIEVGDRLRTVDPAWVEFLAASIAERGQDTPVWVRKMGRSEKYALIAGGHRIAALKEAGKEVAIASVVKATEAEAQLLEIDENLIRRELTPLDRATFLARRKEVYEALYPETKHGGDRVSDQVAKLGDLVGRFSEATAERLGVSERSIQRAVARYQALAADVRQSIAGTWLAESGSQLDELAKLTPDLQRKVAEYISQWPDVRKVSEIVRQIENRPKPPAPEKLEKFLSFWRKCDPEEREQIVEYAAAQMPSVACRAAWDKASDYEKQTIVEDFAPRFPGFAKTQVAA